MANVQHSSLTGAELHEPKGADSASTGQVYVADGSASGSWATAGSIEAAKNASTNGYVVLPGGLMLIWGAATLASGISTSFVTPFPNNCFSVVAVHEGSNGNINVTVRNINRFNFTMDNNTGGTIAIRYIAVGN